MPKRTYDILLVVFALVFVLYTARKPIYNWDMIAYMGVVEEYSVHDIEKVHNNVYHTLQTEVPADVYAGLTDHEDDRYECLTDANVFHDELSFFRAKPLYTILVFLFYKAGLPFVISTMVPSMIAGFAILLIAYSWLCSYFKKHLAFLATILLSLLPAFAELVRLSTPDALSNMLLLFATYLIATDKSKRWLVFVLGLSLLARVDNFIFIIAFVFYVFMNGKFKVDYRMMGIAVIAILGVLGIPMLFGDSFNWFTKFAFLFSWSEYLHHWKVVVFDFRTSQYLLLLLLSIFLYRSGDKKTMLIIKIIAVTFATRLLLFPSIQERFFVSFEFTIAILLIGFMQHIATQKMPQQLDAAANNIIEAKA